MNPDGSSQANLTNNGASDFEYAWSPDSLRIAFVTGRNVLVYEEIYIMNADGSDQRLVIASPGEFTTNLAWQP